MIRPQFNLRAFFCGLLLLVSLPCPLLRDATAQTAPVRHEQLLNGLNIMLLPHPGEEKFFLKLQVKSGAAFDLAGKEGTMALLGDALVPEQSAREDITEAMGGRFEVSTDYDSLSLTIAGRETDFERYVELLRNYLLNPPLTDENVEKLKAARANTLRQTGASPAAMADRAIATRLFGTYPYGRQAAGTPESLARINRSDLLLARDRFLTANNSTLILASNLDSRRVLRVFKQLLGSWRRSENIAPATFRQPGPYDARTLIVDLPGAESVDVRLAARGFGYGQPEALAARLLALIAQERWSAAMPEAKTAPIFVRHEAHALGGIFLMGATVPLALAPKALTSARSVARSLATMPPAATEFARAKGTLLAQLEKENNSSDAAARALLDMDLYQIKTNPDPIATLNHLSAQDLAKVSTQLFPDEHVASIAVGPTDKLAPALSQVGSIEILGAPAPPAAAVTGATGTTKPGLKPPVFKMPVKRP